VIIIEIFRLFGSIFIDTADAEKSLSGVSGKAKKSGDGIFGAFGRAAKGIGKIAAGIGVFKLVDKGMGMIISSTGRAISRVDALNQFPKVLQQMGYGANEAASATDKLVKGIDGLPTTLDGITGDTQRLVNVFQDVDLAAESAIGLNNAFLASGASTADASRGMEQYIQMLSTGKVDMTSWRTLQETMPYALQETAESFGFTGRAAQTDFYDALKDGDITMDEFNDKIIELSDTQGGFAEVAIEATKGISTSWSNIQTAIVNGVAKTIQSFDDWLESAGFGGIPGVLDTIKAKVGEAFNRVNEVIPVVLEWFTVLYGKISDSTAFNTLKQIVTDVASALAELWQKFSESEALDAVKELFIELWDAILELDFEKIAQDVADFVTRWTPLIAGVTAGILAFKLITAAIALWTTVTTIATGVGTAFAAVMAFITSPIGIVVIAIGVLIAAGVFLYKNWETVSVFLKTAWLAIKVAATSVFNSIKTTITNVFNAIKLLSMVVWNSIRSFLTGIFNGIRSVVSSVFNSIRTTITTVFNSIRTTATTVWNGIRTSISTVVNGIRTTITTVFNGVKTTVTTIFNSVKTAMTTPITAAADTIKGIIDKVKGFFSGLKLKFPKITMPKMPSFSLDGKFGLLPPSVPKLKVNWNAVGGVFNKPTLFNTANAGLQGVGEAGSEAILPLNSKVLAGIGKGIASTMGDQSATNNMSGIESLLMNILQAIIDGKNIIIDGKVLGEVTDVEQGKRTNLNGRVAY